MSKVMKKVGIVALILLVVVSFVVIFILGDVIVDLDNEVEDLQVSQNDYLTKLTNRSEEIEEKDKVIKELETKVDSASPWFEMKESEQEAEKERIAEEKVQEEAEAQAQKEEDEIIAEEKRIEKEKAEKEAEAQKYNTGITYEDLARNPVDNTSKLVTFQGKILQVMKGEDNTQYRMAIDSNYDKVVLIVVPDTELEKGNILENDVVTIEGMFLNETEYKTVRGDTRTIPLITVTNLLR